MTGSPTTSTHALHAALVPAPALVDERRTLYRLAAEMFAPGTELSDNLADHPIVRYEIGRALAGHGDLDPAVLTRVASMGVRDAGVPVVSDPAAAEVIEAPLRIVAPSGARPEPLTEADGERFESALHVVEEGVRLLWKFAPDMAEDLLAHVSMLAVLKRETSGGLVSASSRYVPGIVLIDEPALPMEVAEALVHEGAHEKFFDLAITRDFLDLNAEAADYFENSWSQARWPLEQTFAAWHAYSCLAQFNASIGPERLGPDSLLSKAKVRADEIGRWLLAHEIDLRSDARWLLRALANDAVDLEGGGGVRSEVDDVTLSSEISENGHFRLLPDVSFKRAASGRVVVGRAARPVQIFWLDQDASWAVDQWHKDSATEMFGRLLARAAEEWQADFAVAAKRLRAAIGSLLSSSIAGSPEVH
ncbi:HEXXH motif-containing putative peptide modification protein [Lentzea sp. HUAS12]|uniref:aKG-HExxH-type peptide beta-hydroxylase n=1 Tax=Lentzea sp. HUAS12 TaxID=2951806 RepID=UPI00209DF90B|nr:HEXXH motif-containing putative peptide modification protein [Lentzea sp. HUAS12]USX48859.1 HEXXH motif-containing putative peptide modification protein [Lentzea sp. HUAS12]